MMRRLFSALFIVMSVVTWGTVASAQDQARDFSPDSARVYRASDGESLAPASGGSPIEVVRGFLRGNGQTDATANSLVLESSITDDRSGVTHTRLSQQVAGLSVYGTYVRATATADGRLVSVAENLAPVTPAALVLAQITQAEALAAVLAEWYPTFTETLPETSSIGNTTEFEGGTFFFKNPTVTRVVVPMASGALHGGYLVTTWDDDDNMLRHTIVGRTGNILAVQVRTSADTYRVYEVNPDVSVEQDVSRAEPDVWVSGATTSGPNAIAYLDSDNNDTLNNGEQPPATGTDQFLYSVDFSQDPESGNNRWAAVVNLFYQNNILHDTLNGHGFTPAFGNFEGDDPVLAEAQDGEGMNNANFATEVDGTSSRMQMFLWNLTPTVQDQRRDGSLDFDIIAHEYGHGVTWRMVGDMSGPFGGASGEGFSDVLATWLTDEDRVAEYSSGWANGIRSTGYGTHGGTYANFTGASVHNDGEIYAATMWDLRTAWITQGWPENELFDVAISGLASTLPQPAFEDMRDGLLLAIAGSGWADKDERTCLVWDTFAARGIGYGAQGELLPRGPRFYAIRITESDAVPTECQGDPPANSDPVANAGGPYSGTVDEPVSFDGSGSSDPDSSDSLTYSWSFGDGASGSGESPSHTYVTDGTFTVTLTVDDGRGGVDSATAQVTVGLAPPPPPAGSITLDDAVGSKVRGVKSTVLAWTGGPADSVYVFRNGSPIFTDVNNDGAHTDEIGKGGGSVYTYKICEDGSGSTCSNEVTVVF